MTERFTAAAQAFSQWMGEWYVAGGAALLLLAYALFGLARYGDQFITNADWNWPIMQFLNVSQFFIGLLIATAANRVEQHNRGLLERIEQLERKELAELEHLEEQEERA